MDVVDTRTLPGSRSTVYFHRKGYTTNTIWCLNQCSICALLALAASSRMHQRGVAPRSRERLPAEWPNCRTAELPNCRQDLKPSAVEHAPRGCAAVTNSHRIPVVFNHILKTIDFARVVFGAPALESYLEICSGIGPHARSCTAELQTNKGLVGSSAVRQ